MLHIVDDEEVIRDSLSWLARSRGIATTSYESGAAFLAALDKSASFDAQGECLLLDVRMPDMSGAALFDTLAARFGDRNGGYLRIVRAGWQKGDGADKAFVELLGSEQVQEEKRQKRAEVRAKRAAETKKAMEEAEAQAQAQGETAPETNKKEEDKE